MLEFGLRSKRALSTMHPDLQKVFSMAIKMSLVDFGITEGERTIEKQQEYFDDGKSKVDPSSYDDIMVLMEKGKHLTNGNFPTSRAGDVYIFVKGKPELAYDPYYLCHVGGVLQTCSNYLYSIGEIRHTTRWGYNWDSDGEIGTDQKFQDMPHHELVGVKPINL